MASKGLIERQAIGRSGIIGSLYDVRTEQFVMGNLFQEALSPEFIHTSDCASVSYWLDYHNSQKETLDNLNIEASLKIGLMAGLLKLEGSAKYLNQTKTDSKIVRVTFIYKAKTKQEDLRVSGKGLQKYFSSYAFKNPDVTHVVIGITWGGNVAATFERTVEKCDDVTRIEGALGASLTKPAFNVTGDAKVHYDNQQKKDLESLRISFSGDVLIEDCPQTIDQVMKVYSSVPSLIKSLNNGKGKQLTFTLCSLQQIAEMTKLARQSTRLIKEVSEDIINHIENIFEQLNNERRKLNDFLDEIQSWAEYIHHEWIDIIKQKISKFNDDELELKRRLSHLLVKIRGGKAEESEMKELIGDFNQHPCSPKSIEEFLRKNKRIKNKIKTLRRISPEKKELLIDLDSIEDFILDFYDNDVYLLHICEQWQRDEEEDSLKQKDNSSKPKEDSSKQKEDPSKQKENSSKPKEDLLRQSETSLKQKDNSSKQKEKSSRQREDLLKQKEDLLNQSENSLKQMRYFINLRKTKEAELSSKAKFWIIDYDLHSHLKSKPANSVIYYATRASIKSRDYYKDSLKKLQRKEIEQILNENSKLTERNLLDRYKQFMNDHPDGELSDDNFIDELKKIFPKGNPENFCTHVFGTIDQNKTGKLDFSEFMSAYALLRSGNLDTRLDLVFSVCDYDRAGTIGHRKIIKFIEVIAELNKGSSAINTNAAKSVAKKICDENTDGAVTKETFIKCCKDSNEIIMAFLPNYKPPKPKSTSASLLSSPPTHTNPTLEKKIDESKNKSELELDDLGLTDDDMLLAAYYLLQNNKTHTILDLSKNRIEDKGAQYLAEALQDNNTLKELNVSENQIGPQGIQSLAEALQDNTSLKELYLSENQIGDQGAQYVAEALQDTTTLTILDLDNNDIGLQGVQPLAEALQDNTTLKELYLSKNQIGPKCAQALAEALRYNITLTRLSLDKNEIGDQGAQSLAEALQYNKILTRLDLDKNQIGSQGAQYLAKALQNNTTLTILFLSENQIGYKGAQYLAEVLQNNKSLKQLYLSENQIGYKGTQYLAEALQNNKTLKELNLDKNQIGSQGARFLADVLQNNTILTRLDLDTNQIGYIGTQLIAKALQNNTTLKEFYFSENQIGYMGAQYLAEALQDNTTLTILYISKNQIGDTGTQYLAEVLQNNTTLTKLNLDKNQIGSQGVQFLAEALENNRTLIKLSLDNNEIGDQGVEHIEKLKKINENLDISLDQSESE